MVFERTKEDIFELLEHATTDVNGIYKRAQLIVNDNDPLASDLFLLEITPALADQLLTSTTSFSGSIKSVAHAQQEEPAFFCSSVQTYKLLETETSNSMLLIPSLKIPIKTSDPFWNVPDRCVNTTKVRAIKNTYLEMSPVRAPSLKKLKNVLIPSIFSGHIEDEDQTDEALKRFYTYQELRDKTPCSEKELLIALEKLHVMSWKGHCRMFEVEYLNKVLQAIFDLADENAWKWAEFGFPAAAVVQNLSELYPDGITRQVLQRFFYRRHRYVNFNADYVFPRTGKICQIIGEHLLSVTNRFALKDFFSVWSSAVPHGMRPRLRKHLTCAGRATFSSAAAANGYSISLLRAEDLPDESVEARLETLFERQPVWPDAELAGFISDLVVGVEPSPAPLSLLPFNEKTESNLVVFSDDEEEKEEEEQRKEADDEMVGDVVIFDAVKPIPTVLGTLLTHSCRVSAVNTPWGGRTYTEKYSRI